MAISWQTRLTPKSLRLRLALLAALLLCLIQILLSAIFYSVISSWLYQQVDQTLQTTAAQVSTTLASTDTNNSDDLNFQFSGENKAADAFLREQTFFIRVIDQQSGHIVDESATYNLPVTTSARKGSSQFETLSLSDKDSELIRVYTQPLNQPSHLALQVGQSLQSVEQTRYRILGWLGLMLGATALLALGSGWFLARRALIPIEAITRLANQIGETDLSQRIELRLPNDEVGRLAQTFNRMLDRIQELFQHQRRFTADAAHELRTPLSIIQVGLDVNLSHPRTAEQYRETLLNIQEEVERLTQLTSNLLMLARADSRSLPMNYRHLDLSQLLRTVVDYITAAAQQKGIGIELDIPPGVAVTADEDRLIQVAINLLDNAVKYTPEQGHIHVTLRRHPTTAQFTIADTGSGIAADDLPHIFEPFYRADRSRTRTAGGLGLGLAIAHEIVQLHGGHISAVSQPGHGAQFTVTLPTS